LITNTTSHAKQQGPGQEAGHAQAREGEDVGEARGLGEGRKEEERRGSGVGRGREGRFCRRLTRSLKIDASATEA
jgi:hypothetical protein